ncbi:MAG TPA: isoprenylcysteine carboxylmethyltransferase family protein [Thermomicrobiaceae bacterium]|nr:isoprenylcysteine carboxylmethyltransferase family protein [Thermomicrobiaceae bacterium]
MDPSDNRSHHTTPDLLAPAPLIYAGGLAAGWLAEKIIPARKVYGFRPVGRLRRMLGTGMIGAGLALGGWAAKTMIARGASPNPHHPATELVVTGPFQYSRNPLYLSMLVTYLGICYRANLTWSMRLLPVIQILMREGVIEPEEEYLTTRFGEEYLAYQGSVGRWFGWGPAWAAIEQAQRQGSQHPRNEPGWAKFLRYGTKG